MNKHLRIFTFIFTLIFFFTSTVGPAWAAISYTYDANGNQTSNGTNCYEYNDANQLKKVTNCTGQTIAEYVYDYNGNRMVKKNYTNGALNNTVTSWSDSFETKSATGNATSSASVTISHTYNNHALSGSTLTISNVTVASGEQLIVSANGSDGAASDTRGEVTGVTFGGVALTKIVEDTLGLGDDGIYTSFWQLSSPTPSTANVVITYNGAPAHGIEGTAYTIANAQTTINANAHNGNGSSAASPQTNTITTTADNALILDSFMAASSTESITVGGTPQVQDFKVQDAGGSPFGKSHVSQATHGAQTMSWTPSNTGRGYTWSAIALVPTTGGGGGSVQTTSYYFANNELIAKKDSSGVMTYVHNDHLGSSSVITNAIGALVEATSYDPWGKVMSGGTTSKFQYTGQEKDSETGLNYYNARYYSSDIRRFTQPDDIIPDLYNPQTLNRYSYVNNNPLRYTDPSGHAAFAATPLLLTNPWGWAALGTFALYEALTHPKETKAMVSTVVSYLIKANTPTNPISQLVNVYNAAKNAITSTTKQTTPQTGGGGGAQQGGGGSQTPKQNPFQKIAPIIPAATSLGAGNSNAKATVSQGLDAAETWLGNGYNEIDSGVFRSADNLRQFRMTDSELNAKIPHFNFETVAKDGRQLPDNLHLILIDFNK